VPAAPAARTPFAPFSSLANNYHTTIRNSNKQTTTRHGINVHFIGGADYRTQQWCFLVLSQISDHITSRTVELIDKNTQGSLANATQTRSREDPLAKRTGCPIGGCVDFKNAEMRVFGRDACKRCFPAT
jgi:hypothetical protein